MHPAQDFETRQDVGPPCVRAELQCILRRFHMPASTQTCGPSPRSAELVRSIGVRKGFTATEGGQHEQRDRNADPAHGHARGGGLAEKRHFRCLQSDTLILFYAVHKLQELVEA